MGKLISTESILKGRFVGDDREGVPKNISDDQAYRLGWNDALEAVAQCEPEAVVRCKDCLYREDDKMCEYKTYWVVAQDDNDFCSWGKRREDGNDPKPV